MKSANNQADSKEMTIRDLIFILRSWLNYLASKKLVLFCALLFGLVVGALFSLLSNRKYVAKATFVLEESVQASSMDALSGISSALGGSAPGTGLFAGDNIIWLYSSDRMIAEALLTAVDSAGKRVLLINWLAHIDDGLHKTVQKINKQSSGFEGFADTALSTSKLSRSQGRVLNAAIKIIRDNYLDVETEENTNGIIKVTLSSSDEMFAHVFVSQIVETVNDFYIETKTKKGKEQVFLLQNKVDEFNRNMNVSMYQAASAADEIPFANPVRQTLKVAPQRSSVDVQVNSVIYSAMVQQLEAAKVALAKATPLIQIVDKPRFPLPVKRPSIFLWTLGLGLLSGFLASFLLLAKRLFREAVR